MAQLINITLEANGSTDWATIVNPNNGATPYQMIAASGTFGSGSLALEMSVDGGTTAFAITDSVGAVALTAAGGVVTNILGDGNLPSQVKIRATLSGATSPSVTVIITDAR